MKSYWQINQGSKSAIIFCNGWGMDGNPVSFLDSDAFDVFILYDYRDLSNEGELQKIVLKYDVIYLVCWSMGVWAGQYLFQDKEKYFKKKIAINGTLKPIDNSYGIPEAIYNKTIADYSDDGQDKFYRRMCKEKGVLKRFMTIQPQRTVADQLDELIKLKEMVSENHFGNSIFTDVIVSKKDLVMPTAHQKAFWKDNQVFMLEGCHFPFTRWNNWDEIVSFIE